MEHDINKLEASLRTLDDSLARISGMRIAEQLIPIIHRPGWTTLAEFALVAAGLEAMQRQADSLTHMVGRLVEAVGQVGNQR